jgi:hypothetical protein
MHERRTGIPNLSACSNARPLSSSTSIVLFNIWPLLCLWSTDVMLYYKILIGALVTHFVKCLNFRFLAIRLDLVEYIFNVIAYFDPYNRLVGDL